MLISPDIEKGFVAGVFGLIGTLIPAGISWLHERDANATRIRKLEEFTKRIAFWDQWLKLSAQLPTPPEPATMLRICTELGVLGRLVQADSDNVHAEMTNAGIVASEYKAAQHSLPFYRQWFLLYRPERSLAWFPRLLFFFCIPIELLLLLMSVPGVYKEADGDFYLGDIVLQIMAIAFCLVFRSLSRWLEQPHAALNVAPPLHVPTPPPPH